MVVGPTTKDFVFYVLECEVENCDAEFYLNDIPIIRRGPALGRFFAGQSNQYLIDGVNELAIVVNPGPTPGEALVGSGRERGPLPGGEARAVAKLSTYPYGSISGGPDGRELLSLEWRATGDTPQIFPRVATARGELGTSLGTWQWQNAARLEMGELLVEEIEGFLRPLHLSLLAGSPDVLIEASQIRIAETENAYSLEPGEKERQIRTVTRQEAKTDWWGLLPLEPEQFDFRLCAHDRLVECIGKDWEPVLRENVDREGGQGTYSLFLGLIDDEWHIVR